MAFDGFVLYLLAKYKRDMQKDNFMMDMLWAAGVHCAFHDDKGRPTYPRWHEVINPNNPKEEQPEVVVTKEAIRQQFKRLRG